MKRKRIVFWLVLTVAILLTGCSMSTVDQLYCLPKRPEGYMNLQNALDKAMADYSYHAPLVGDNRQPVQMKDLDGDGQEECLVFAKGGGANPLKILFFRQVGEAYVLADILEGAGSAFEQVQYVHMTDRDGYDLVVTRQITEQGVRPMEIYSLENGKLVQINTTSHMRFMVTDLNADSLDELLILRRGENAAANGYLDLFEFRDGDYRSYHTKLSVPADNIHKIQLSNLNDGLSAVYITGSVNESTIVTDVVTWVNDQFANITVSDVTGFSEKTWRNAKIQSMDSDGDGKLELPCLLPQVGEGFDEQYLIRWYELNSDGSEETVCYTFHNYAAGWYLDLPKNVAATVNVVALGSSFEFSIPAEDNLPIKLLTVYAFTGPEREELAVSENRFVLFRNESTVFAGHLEVASAAYDLTQESLIEAFRFIATDQTV